MKKLLLLLVLTCTVQAVFATATVTQKEWRWRNDDGNETSATWKAPQDQQATLNLCTSLEEVIRLRMVLQINPDPANPSNTASKTATRTIAYSTSQSGPWTTIVAGTGASGFEFSSSAEVTNGTATTQQLTTTSGAFAAGSILDGTDNTMLNFTTPPATVTHREYEWVIKPLADLQAATYYFRYTGADNTSGNLPSLLVYGGETSFTQTIETTCGSYTSPSGNTLTTSGTYNDTIPNVNGCDSVITTNLTLNPNTSVDVRSACHSFTWNNGVTYTESTSDAMDTLTNVNGCDSIVTLILTITSIETDLTFDGTNIEATYDGAENYQWINCSDTTELQNGATPSFSPSQNGLYSVIITENGCSDTSACLLVNTLGLNKLSDASSIVISPNPTSGVFSVIFTGEASAISITDLHGNVISNEKLVTSGTKIDLSSFANGIYLISLQTTNGVITRRVVKN